MGRILEEINKREAPKWFGEAKFGIFIHWGVYSVPAYRAVNDEQFGAYAEWYYASVYGNYRNNGDNFHKKVYGDKFCYRDFAKTFKAELFEPDYIAQIIKKSGAKYAILTTKHHDGYCMWGTKNKHKKNWNSRDIGPKIDLTKKYKEALCNVGIEFGVYYSIIDWESVPSHRTLDIGGYFVPKNDVEKYGLSKERYLDEVLRPQLKEIVELFSPSIIFSDGGEWDLSEEESGIKEFLDWLYNESDVKDKVLVNDRFFKDMPCNYGDYYSTEYKDKVISNGIWEENRGIGKSYGYNRAEKIYDYNTSKQLIYELARTVSLGGNFLLNIGPMADGTIPIHEVERLLEIGAWLDICGEGIYGSIGISTNQTSYMMTKKNENIYVFLNKVDYKNIILKIDDTDTIREISILGVEENIMYKIEKDIISFTPKNIEKLIRNLERFGLITIKIKRGN